MNIIPFVKINKKMDHRPKYKIKKTMQLLEENIEKITDDLGYDNTFLDTTLIYKK